MSKQQIQLVSQSQPVYPVTDAQFVSINETTVKAVLESLSTQAFNLDRVIRSLFTISNHQVDEATQKLLDLVSSDAYTGLALKYDLTGLNYEGSWRMFRDWVDGVEFYPPARNYWGRCAIKVFNANIEVQNFLTDSTSGKGAQMLMGPVTLLNGELVSGYEVKILHRTKEGNIWSGWSEIKGITELAQNLTNLSNSLQTLKESFDQHVQKALVNQGAQVPQTADKVTAVSVDGESIAPATVLSAVYDDVRGDNLSSVIETVYNFVNSFGTTVKGGKIKDVSVLSEIRDKLHSDARTDYAQIKSVASIENAFLLLDSSVTNELCYGVTRYVTPTGNFLECTTIPDGDKVSQVLLGRVTVDSSGALVPAESVNILTRSGDKTALPKFSLLADVEGFSTLATKLAERISKLNLTSRVQSDGIEVSFVDGSESKSITIPDVTDSTKGLMTPEVLSKVTDNSTKVETLTEDAKKIKKDIDTIKQTKDDKVFMTVSEYEALLTKDPNKLYFLYE